MRTNNPMLRSEVFTRSIPTVQTMEIQGVINKTGFLLILTIATAMWPWSKVMSGDGSGVQGMIATGLIVGLIAAVAGAFKPLWAWFLAPVYAVAEGLALGAISAFFELQYPGIALQAIALTFATMFSMLFLYKARIINATPALKRMIITATMGIMVVYLISFVLSFFGTDIPMIHEAGPIGIGFSLIVVGIAAFNLILDFDFVESGARDGAPKAFEWFAAMALLVTLVWLYISLLRLLSKLQSRN